MIHFIKCCVFCCIGVFCYYFALAQPNISKAEYYIDTDPGYGNANNITITPDKNITDKTININSASLSFGVHLFGIRARDANGHWSLDNKWLFVKPQAATTTPKTTLVEFYVDTDPGYSKATAIGITAGINISDKTFNINPTTLSAGVHLIGIRARDAGGRWSLDNKWLFIKPAPVASVPKLKSAEYYIDTDPGYGNAKPITIAADTNVSNVAVNINPTTLSSGVHLFGIRAKDAAGHWSLDNKWLFINASPADTVLPNLKAVEFYVDTDPGYGNGVPIAISSVNKQVNFQLPVNIGGLDTGGHKLFIRSKDANNAWSLDNVFLFKVAVKSASPAIITTSIASKNVCIGDAVKVSYQATGAYNSGNIFKVQLSNAAGSFASPIIIGTHKGTDNSIINCTLPASLPYGKLYRMRVVSTNPAVTGITGSDTLTIHAKASPAPTVTPSGDTTICNGSSITLSANTGYTAYNWNSGQSTRQITVDTAGAYKVTVTDSTGCQGTSAPTNVSLKSKPVLSNITGPKTVTAGQDSLVYKVNAAAGVTYNWTVPADAIITAGQGTATITVTWGSTAGQVSVNGSNNCGKSAVKKLSVTVTGTLIAFVDEKQAAADKLAKLYPNPSTNTTTLAFYADKEDDYAIDVTDMAGKLLQQIKGRNMVGANTVTLNMSRYAQGMYLIVLKNKNNGMQTLKFSKE